VTVYRGGCPAAAGALSPTHPDAVEVAYSVLNRYLDEPFSLGIPEGHFLVDRSGYIRARFQHFAPNDGNVAALRAQIALTASEPIVPISLHSH
jgi:putative copper resistance protein D